jgi:uncharacterized protein
VKKLLLLTIFLFSLVYLYAKEIPKRPEPPRLVNDFANILSDEEEAALESKLKNYNDSTSTQIAVVTEKSIEGEDIADYSQRLGEAWGIGQKGKNNGLLIYIAFDDHQIDIETGYGMEAILPDALAKRLIEQVIKPRFKQEQYYAGLDEATTAIMKLASGEYKADDIKKEKGSKIPIWLIILIIILIALFSNKSGGRGRGTISSRGAYWGGGFGGGSWGGGRSSGGGFGGFGGGSFGGGGASGSW